MKKTVVIIDDSRFLVGMLRDFFQNEMGFEVLATGTNGIHAVELYRKHQPDILTLDLTMPVKDGRAALKEILADFPEARILIISAVNGSSILECIILGARAYIEKPLRLEDEEFRKDFRQTLAEALKERAAT